MDARQKEIIRQMRFAQVDYPSIAAHLGLSGEYGKKLLLSERIKHGGSGCPASALQVLRQAHAGCIQNAATEVLFGSLQNNLVESAQMGTAVRPYDTVYLQGLRKNILRLCFQQAMLLLQRMSVEAR